MGNKKLGGGIITIAVLYFISLGIGIIGSIILLFNFDQFNSIYSQVGIIINSTDIILSLVLSALLLITLILILLKKKFGVYSFFTLIVINIIYSFVMNGFAVTTIISALLGLILPGLLAFFINKKKELFGFESKNSDITA